MTSRTSLPGAAKAAAWCSAGALGITMLSGVAYASGQNQQTSTAPASFAAAASGANPNAAAPNAQRGPGKRLGRNMLHGDITLSTKDGVKTLRVQRGKVTAATDTKITVESSDGYVSTYAITSDTKVKRNGGDVKGGAFVAGDQVMVVAVISGDSVTARSIRGLSAAKAAERAAKRAAKASSGGSQKTA